MNPLFPQGLIEHAVSAAKAIAADAESLRPPPPTPTQADAVGEYDRRITDPGLRAATKSRFDTGHYADAVEAGVKALCDLIRQRSGSHEDGDSLMTQVFSVNAPILRINAGKTKNDANEQKGHMLLCQGVVAAWRNPRAHSLIDDSSERALLMLEMIGELMAISRNATRTRQRKPRG